MEITTTLNRSAIFGKAMMLSNYDAKFTTDKEGNLLFDTSRLTPSEYNLLDEVLRQTKATIINALDNDIDIVQNGEDITCTIYQHSEHRRKISISQLDSMLMSIFAESILADWSQRANPSLMELYTNRTNASIQELIKAVKTKTEPDV